MASSSLNNARAIRESGFRTINMDFPTEDLLKNTRYGEQLCTIGLVGAGMPVVVRQALHPSEINPPWLNSVGFLNPVITFENGDYTFIAYYEHPSNDKFEMTLGWYMKLHRKGTRNSLSLTGQCNIEPALISRPHGKWALSETFKDFLIDIIEKIQGLHEKGYTHGHLSPNNIVIKSSNWGKILYQVKIVNCIQQHDLEKGESKVLFEALRKKDWEDFVKIIEDITTGIEDWFDYEFTKFMNTIKISKEQQNLSSESFNHPGIWLRRKKTKLFYNMRVKIAAQKMSELGLGFVRVFDLCDYYCRSSDILNSMGYTSLELYLQRHFPNLFLTVHQLEPINAFPN